MPIFKLNNKLLYFAHIPKCGGTSVENFMSELKASTSFRDSDFLSKKSDRWNKSSPQHIDGQSLEILFPNQNVFDHIFTVVRNPVDRFASAFYFNRHRYDEIENKMTIDEFVSQLDSSAVNRQGFMDNHFMPSTHFLAYKDECKVFKLEGGMIDLQKWIEDQILGRKSNVQMKRQKSFDQRYPQIEVLRPNRASLNKIYELYKDDFLKFGYQL